MNDKHKIVYILKLKNAFDGFRSGIRIRKILKEYKNNNKEINLSELCNRLIDVKRLKNKTKNNFFREEITNDYDNK